MKSRIFNSFAALLTGFVALLTVSVQAEDLTTERHVLAFGDSLTAGYGLDPDDSYPSKLQAALAGNGVDVTVVNGGVSGDTTAGGRARLAWSLKQGPADGFDLVILELGANDALRGFSPQTTRDNLHAMLSLLQEHGIPVLLAGMMAPRNYGPDYAAAFDPIYPELAAEFGVPLYPFFLEGVATDPALNLEDGMHPNAAGIEVIVDKLLPIVQTLLMPEGAS